MKRIFLVALIAAVVAVSGCTSQTPTQDQAPQEPTGEEPDTPPESPNGTSIPTDNFSTHTVYYTSSGFQPSEVTITRGETVVWLNNASSPMWVASNRHPVHSEYAGSSLREHCQDGDQTNAAFDQCSSGDRFSFTFEKTGEWEYHNHERSAFGGTVTVVE